MGTFWPCIRPQWPLLLISSIALLANEGLRVLEPWPLKIIFDEVLIPARSGAPHGLPGLATLDPVMLLTAAAISVVDMAGLRTIAAYWSTVSLVIVGSRVSADHEISFQVTRDSDALRFISDTTLDAYDFKRMENRRFELLTSAVRW